MWIPEQVIVKEIEMSYLASFGSLPMLGRLSGYKRNCRPRRKPPYSKNHRHVDSRETPQWSLEPDKVAFDQVAARQG